MRISKTCSKNLQEDKVVSPHFSIPSRQSLEVWVTQDHVDAALTALGRGMGSCRDPEPRVDLICTCLCNYAWLPLTQIT